MTEEIKQEVIKKTQDTLGKFIKRPPLTEKLLKKPPFRFLHDVITGVINETGFLTGLYSETEMKSENITDRDSKIAYLEKLIDCLKIVTNKEVSAKPSRIVAGVEVTKTNELLQLIAFAINKKLDSSSAVTRVLQGDQITNNKTKNSNDDKRAAKTKEKNDNKPKTTPKNITPRIKKSEDLKSKKVDEKNSLTKIKSSSKIIEKDVKKDKVTIKTDKKDVKKKESKERNDKKSIKPKDSPKETSKKIESKIIKSETSFDSAKLEENTIKKELEEAPIQEIITEELESNLQTVRTPQELQKLPEFTATPPPTEKKFEPLSEKIQKPETQSENLSEKVEITTKKSPTMRQKPKTEPLVASPVNDIPLATEMMTMLSSKEPPKLETRPKTSLRPPSVRPSSARPGAPRLKDKNNEIVLPQDEIVPMGKVNVIVENFSSNQEDDNEETVVVETPQEIALQESTVSQKTEMEIPAEKGHLVAQILEQINDINETEPKKQVEIEWEAGGNRNREAANKEIEKLRESIQTLTKAANPLGKLMNFLQEDIDSMRTELKMWIGVNEKLGAELKIHDGMINEIVEPMKKQLIRLEEDITKQHDLISISKSNIMKNEQKIKSLLARNG